MLVTREELRFDFRGSTYSMQSEADRRFLGWIFNQFLYGEVTGIQCGYWLYRAPSVNAASFLAKQAGEELSHFRKFLRILSILGEKPAKPHWAIRFLATGMMGGSWGEHVALEMALGEGLVLGVFYAMAETVGNPEIQKILESSAIEEERHVEFGERETQEWLKLHPEARSFLLGQALLQTLVLRRLKNFVARRVQRELGETHPVMSNFGAFYDHMIRCFELRVERLGLSPAPLRQLSFLQKFSLLAGLPVRILISKIRFKNPLLTESYLRDPLVSAELKRFPLSSIKPE